MKSETINTLEMGYPYTHKLIYVDVTPEHREALAIFDLEGEAIEAYKAEKKAKRRLANIIFYDIPEEYTFDRMLAVFSNPVNAKITNNVKSINVRFSPDLRDYDSDKEIQYFWDFSKIDLLKPFCGGFGVIPESTPYTISSRKENPIFYGIISTTDDLDG
jgi:hypothetical protein